MTSVATKGELKGPSTDGLWWWEGWSSPRILAGVAGRSADPAAWARQLPGATRLIQAEQVHGASLALIEHAALSSAVIPGCDALLTRLSGVALIARSADCLPLFVSDPRRGAIGIIHAGWRGLASELPMRVVAAFRHLTASAPAELDVAIGPGIRACCYEVSPDFGGAWCHPFLAARDGRWYCDLPAAARAQLLACGVRPARLVDSGLCTACALQTWYSLRREGEATGRLSSFIMGRA